ncbi:hypothetical protein IFM89_038245 [Coptis chinensis]|uniref:Uncharacterized protein n=1 Tax=Coptis chinensis TaxID=261450 RepID=A0A835LU62_9MAGN|nr:hypothetical protein IFM89_038245 [Coptis chinensis]
MERAQRKCSFCLAQLLVPFFESITEQVIPEDLLVVHSEIVRAGEVRSDADVSEDMHCDESASGVQEGSNDMSSKSDPFLAPTYESEDSADDIEVNEQGERINVVFEPVNVRLLDENMPLNTTLPTSRGENVEGGITSGSPQVEPKIRNVVVGSEVFGVLASGPVGFGMYVDFGLGGGSQSDVLVKKRSKTIEQAAPISVDEAASSTGCHPQTPSPIVTTVESAGDCGMDDGPMKKKSDMDKQGDIQLLKMASQIKLDCADDPDMFHLMSLQQCWDPMNWYQYSRRKQYQCSRMYKNKHLSE